jgi:hypothetical protein
MDLLPHYLSPQLHLLEAPEPGVHHLWILELALEAGDVGLRLRYRGKIKNIVRFLEVTNKI